MPLALPTIYKLSAVHRLIHLILLIHYMSIYISIFFIVISAYIKYIKM